MIYSITNDYLLGSDFFVSGNYFLDFKNKKIYKVYKVQQKENFSRLDTILKNFKDAIIIFKTCNYYSEIFSSRVRKEIFKDFSGFDFSKLTQEELEIKISGDVYKKYQTYDEIYKKLGPEIQMRSKNLRPVRLIYLLLPVNMITVGQNVVENIMSKKDTIFSNEKKFMLNVEKSTFSTYNSFYAAQLNNYRSLNKLIYDSVIKPSIDISSLTGQKNTAQIDSINIYADLEKNGNCFPVDEEEITGLFNSFFYDSIYTANRYFNIFNLFNEQIRSLKDGELYYNLFKILLKKYNFRQKINNSILKTFNSSNLLFFISGFRNIVDKDYNFINLIDNVDLDISLVLKVSEVKKDFVIDYINKLIAKVVLRMEDLQKKEEISFEMAKRSIEAGKLELDHYKALQRRISDEHESLFIISGYFIQEVMNEFQTNNIYNSMNINGLNIKQLSPEIEEYRKLLNIITDKSGSFIHTTPILHYLDFYKPFSNSNIIGAEDAEKMKHITTYEG